MLLQVFAYFLTDVAFDEITVDLNSYHLKHNIVITQV